MREGMKSTSNFKFEDEMSRSIHIRNKNRNKNKKEMCFAAIGGGNAIFRNINVRIPSGNYCLGILAIGGGHTGYVDELRLFRITFEKEKSSRRVLAVSIK